MKVREKSVTFPKLDNPLCSGLPSALSTFEQSALWGENEKEFFITGLPDKIQISI